MGSVRPDGSPGWVGRRDFLGLAALGLGGAPLLAGAPRILRDAADPGSAEPPVVVGSLPLASPDRPLDVVAGRLRTAREAGVDLALVPVAGDESFAGAARNLVRLHCLLTNLTDEVALVRRAEDLPAAREGGRVGVIAHFRGMQMIVEELALIDQLSAAGVGVMALTGDWKNWNGDGCLERTDLPLTGLGELAVRRLQEAGVALDLSRVGRRSSLRAMELARRPVLFTASNAAAVFDHPRNLTDEQIEACAALDGVIGVSAFPSMVGRDRVEMDDVLRHLEYLVERAGVEHVGLGLGFTDRSEKRWPDDPLPATVPPFPSDLQDVGGVPALSRALAERGYDTTARAAIMGGNFWRALRTAWEPTAA